MEAQTILTQMSQNQRPSDITGGPRPQLFTAQVDQHSTGHMALMLWLTKT